MDVRRKVSGSAPIANRDGRYDGPRLSLGAVPASRVPGQPRISVRTRPSAGAAGRPSRGPGGGATSRLGVPPRVAPRLVPPAGGPDKPGVSSWGGPRAGGARG